MSGENHLVHPTNHSVKNVFIFNIFASIVAGFCLHFIINILPKYLEFPAHRYNLQVLLIWIIAVPFVIHKPQFKNSKWRPFFTAGFLMCYTLLLVIVFQTNYLSGPYSKSKDTIMLSSKQLHGIIAASSRGGHLNVESRRDLMSLCIAAIDRNKPQPHKVRISYCINDPIAQELFFEEGSYQGFAEPFRARIFMVSPDSKPTERGIAGACFLQKKIKFHPQDTDGTTVDFRIFPDEEFAPYKQSKSLICVPILSTNVTNKPIGVLNISSSEENWFSKDSDDVIHARWLARILGYYLTNRTPDSVPERLYQTD